MDEYEYDQMIDDVNDKYREDNVAVHKFIYAVMERCGNFEHTINEFFNHDQAQQFMMKCARKDAQDHFINPRDIPQVEYEMELGNALSYYSIDRWEV